MILNNLQNFRLPQDTIILSQKHTTLSFLPQENLVAVCYKFQHFTLTANSKTHNSTLIWTTVTFQSIQFCPSFTESVTYRECESAYDKFGLAARRLLRWHFWWYASSSLAVASAVPPVVWRLCVLFVCGYSTSIIITNLVGHPHHNHLDRQTVVVSAVFYKCMFQKYHPLSLVHKIKRPSNSLPLILFQLSQDFQ